MRITQAVILAGGRGERLRPLTDTVPKPMVAINGRPFLEYLIELLRDNGIEEVILCTGYLHEKISEHFGDGSAFGLRIRYSVADVACDTGRRLKLAEGLFNKEFLLSYADNYWPLHLHAVRDRYEAAGARALMTVYTNKNGETKNNVTVDNEGYVTAYDRSRTDAGTNGVDIGFFIINRSVLDLLGDENCSFESSLLPVLVRRRELVAYLTDQRYYSISTPVRLAEAGGFLKPKKVVFLDRDGVINKKMAGSDCVKTWEEFSFIPGVREALKLLRDHGYMAVLITNQAGVARGLMTQNDLDTIHEKMKAEIETNGGKIDAIYCCTHGWGEGCACRKPKPGMLLRAAEELTIDLSKAVFIGDDPRDAEAGRLAGCRTILVNENRDMLAVVKALVRDGG